MQTSTDPSKQGNSINKNSPSMKAERQSSRDGNKNKGSYKKILTIGASNFDLAKRKKHRHGKRLEFDERELVPPLTVPATAEAESRDPTLRLVFSASCKSTSPDAGAGSKLLSTEAPPRSMTDEEDVSESEAAGVWQQSVCAPARGAIDRVSTAPLRLRLSSPSPVLRLRYQTYSTLLATSPPRQNSHNTHRPIQLFLLARSLARSSSSLHQKLQTQKSLGGARKQEHPESEARESMIEVKDDDGELCAD
jgi:hypothetical protein